MEPEYVDIDPNDLHNAWPKLLELALAVPFVLGLRTKVVARLLAATLLLEALTVWQFWWVHPLGAAARARHLPSTWRSRAGCSSQRWRHGCDRRVLKKLSRRRGRTAP